MPRRVSAAAAGLIVVLAEPLLRRALSLATEGFALELQIAVGLAVSWAAAGVVVALVILGRRGPAALGLRRPAVADLVLGAGGFVAGLAVVSLSFPLIDALGLESLESGVRRLAVLPPGLRLIAAVSAGITEEVLYRGFLIESLLAMSGRLTPSVLASWALFTLLHLPFWGPGGSLQIGLVSGVLCLIYARRRSIVPCVIAHVMIDAWAFLVVPLMIPEFP